MGSCPESGPLAMNPKNNRKYEDESWLRKQYEVLHKSQKGIARECHCSDRTIFNYLTKFDIKIRRRLRYSIKDLRAEAIKRNGECLSEEYIPKRNQVWRCEFGHEWSALWYNIRAGGWCQTCYHGSKPTIDTAKKLARERGGDCLSIEYINSKTKMLFTCSFGHTWETSYNHIRSGKWCPVCSSMRNVNECYFRDCLENLFRAKFEKNRPEWLISRFGTKLELDGYNEALGVAFEYQGIQHFELAEWHSDTPEKLKRRQQNDIDKAAITRGRGIILLTPSYKLKQKDFVGYIIENLTAEKLEMAYVI